VSFKDDLSYVGVMTYADYDAALTEQELAAAAAKREENAKLLDELVGKVSAQRDELSVLKGRWNKYNENEPLLYLFGTYTENLPSSSWGAPHANPTEDQHPRLLITRDMIPNIRASLREDNITNRNFLANVDKLIANDAILPPAKGQGTNAQVGLANTHNYDAPMLDTIQAKALAYLLYDDPYYGYQAIYYMKNYLRSFDIKQIASDQCRQYGYVMFTAAIVYDWCYPILEEADKQQLIAAVENRICRKTNQGGAAMEVGFPPTRQGSVSGHGAERQILRDYLAFATAIYGDNNSWWKYVAARVYNDYVPMRNYYYQSGTIYQGTGYAAARYSSDLFSAWIIKAATGDTPYNNLAEVTRSLARQLRNA
jgi:heparin/heparan-sulfate lyase